MKYPFTSIIIVYNPNSTGPSKRNAFRLRNILKRRLPKTVKVIARGTKYAGHAEEIAASYAKDDERVLLISSSGDGGYNEIINGALAYKTRHLTVAVMAGGNANDHYHATARDDLVDRVIAGEKQLLDVIDVRATQKAEPWQRYAHSYVGVGLTAYIGKQLAQAKLNPVNEKWLVLKYLVKFGHVIIKLEGNNSWRRYSNVIVANIDRMSKIIQLSDKAEVDDGKTELYITPRQSVLETLRVVMRGAMFGLTPAKRTDQVTFIAKRNSELQCDGEVYQFDGGQPVTVQVQKRRLITLA